MISTCLKGYFKTNTTCHGLTWSILELYLSAKDIYDQLQFAPYLCQGMTFLVFSLFPVGTYLNNFS